jgi:capsular exopolysaccharide synthesis family protein
MEADGQDLKTIVDLLRRRAGLILLVAVLVLGVAGLAVFALKPVYSATALVLVDPSKKNLLDPSAQSGGSGSDSLRVDSEVELVKSETTLLAVAEELSLASDPEFGPRLGLLDTILNLLRLAQPQPPGEREARGAVLSNLRDSVSVQRRGVTFLIAVTARSQRPEIAATIANAVARTYIAQQLSAKMASTLASAELVKQRAAEATATLAESERALDTFIDQNIVRIAGRLDLQQLRDEIATLEAARTRSSAGVERLGSNLERRDWASVAATLGSEAAASLERQRLELLGDAARAAEGSQTAIDLRASLAAVEAQLREAADKSVAALHEEVAAAQVRLSDLRPKLRSSFLQSDLPPEVLAGIYQLQQTSEIARTQYLALLTRQNDLDTQVYLQIADSRLVAEATPPDVPSFPRPDLVLLLAAIAGLGIGVAVAFLVEHFVGGLTSAAQAQSVLKSPLVSVVPRQRRPKVSDGVAPTLVDSLVLTPLSPFPEAIRRIRLGLDQAVRHRQQRAAGDGAVIMVTSAAPGEGKTTVALSLARAYALAGMSTLLIDCDLRNPGIHKLLGIEPSEGLFEYLTLSTDASALKSILALDQGSGARIIVGSRRSDIATDQLVAGKTFARLIAAARENFDVVVLDTPPIGPVVDGLYLAGLTDAIAFVVKFSSTPQQEVRTAMASLLRAKSDGVPIVTILNQQTSHLASYRGKYAGYYAEA